MNPADLSVSIGSWKCCEQNQALYSQANKSSVWGGGIYEEDIFYELCDELGVLVWQDFMFGCGNYPAFPEILESIKEEAVVNLRRIRHHPSIVIFAGNNEDYQVQESFGLEYKYDDKNPQEWLKTDFPARYIYEKVRAHCCGRKEKGFA